MCIRDSCGLHAMIWYSLWGFRPHKIFFWALEIREPFSRCKATIFIRVSRKPLQPRLPALSQAPTGRCMSPPRTPGKSSLSGRDTIPAAASNPTHSTPRYFRTGDVCHGGAMAQRKARSLSTSAPEIPPLHKRIGAPGPDPTRMPREKPWIVLRLSLIHI